MEALVGLVAGIVAFIFELTIHALIFVYLLFRAAFSQSYRQKLREHWDTSTWRRISIVLGIGLYSVALVVALAVWIPLLGSLSDRQRDKGSIQSNEKTVTIEFTSDEVEKIKETKEIEELFDVAGGILKRKLEERKQAKESEEADQ